MSEEKRGIADAENGGTTETMADYARELEASFRTIREGDVISGTVIDVRETGVTLDLGYYAPARSLCRIRGSSQHRMQI